MRSKGLKIRPKRKRASALFTAQRVDNGDATEGTWWWGEGVLLGRAHVH